MVSSAKHEPSSAMVEELVSPLAQHLRTPVDNLSEPFVVESIVEATRSVHVVVIWDRWKALSRTRRSKMIVQAYERSGRAEGRNLTVAMGLTQREALHFGLLPYSLLVLSRDEDRVPRAKLDKAYAKAGGIIDIVGESTVRRFPTQRAAEDAYRRVAAELPGPFWAILHEVGTTGET